jgi:hypothetical protein
MVNKALIPLILDGIKLDDHLIDIAYQCQLVKPNGKLAILQVSPFSTR